ncbi:MAG: CHAT domain-containing protein [bacterium]
MQHMDREEEMSSEGPHEIRSGNIEEILRERDRLEQMLRERFEKEVVILFTDICGYTGYIDAHGDVSGLALIQRHNQIVLPLIEQYRGMVVKTIGDAVMISFSTPLDAVKAAVDIQKKLHEYNTTVEDDGRIRVKIGINIGQALVDEADIHGDVVNVASRIQAQAGPDQILISSRVYEQVRGIEDILCRSHGTVKVKGKTEPLELYRVVWRDEDIILGDKPKVRSLSGASPSRQPARKPVRIIQLEVTRQDGRLKISIDERLAGEESTVRNYEEVPVSLDWIKTRCHEMVETLNEVNRQGRFSREVLLKLRATGRVFYNELLTPLVKTKLRETRAEYLSLNIDDQLVQVPWELLYDGQEFLCQRFNMGRLVKTRQSVQGIKGRSPLNPCGDRVLSRPLRMLIIADPTGDLKDAYREGIQIQEHMAQYGNFINVALRSQGITPPFIREKMKYFDLIHFAGHADYDQENPERGGWRLTSGNLTAQDVMQMAGSSAMPSLIFSNSCQSARTEGWVLKEHFQDEIFGLAHAFLLSGVKHYVGTFWEILDEPSSRFALEFYKCLLSGLTTGEAMREARLSLIRKYGEETAVWASYLLYGDPTTNYLDLIKSAEGDDESESAGSTSAFREGIETGEPGRQSPGKAALAATGLRQQWLLAAGGGLLLLAILFLFTTRLWQPSQPSFQTLPFPAAAPGVLLSQTPGGATADSDFQKSVQIISLLSSYQDRLNSRFKERGFFIREKTPDTWTSVPLSVGMILPDWEKVDPAAARAAKPHFDLLFKRMVETFTQTHALGLSILERERLTAILQELQIGIANLSPDALESARSILAAQVILFPEPVFYQFDQGDDPQISLRLVETKSTKIMAAFSGSFTPEAESINRTASDLVTRIVKTLQEEYPLQGRIVSLKGHMAEINLGSCIGVSKNQSFTVLNQGNDDPPKGNIRILSVAEHTALAEVLERHKEFVPGDRIVSKGSGQ